MHGQTEVIALPPMLTRSVIKLGNRDCAIITSMNNASATLQYNKHTEIYYFLLKTTQLRFKRSACAQKFSTQLYD